MQVLCDFANDTRRALLLLLVIQFEWLRKLES